MNNTIRNAKASENCRKEPVKLAKTKVNNDSHTVKTAIDIEDISFEDKIDEMLKWEKKLYVSKKVFSGIIEYHGVKVNKLLCRHVCSQSTRCQPSHTTFIIQAFIKDREGQAHILLCQNQPQAQAAG